MTTEDPPPPGGSLSDEPPPGGSMPGTSQVLRRPAGAAETRDAQRRFWDWYSPAYQEEHARDLGEVSFVWCPERVLEDETHLLGDVAGRDVIEVGCGAAQCSRWVSERGGRPVGLDLSRSQLTAAQRMAASSGISVPLVQADAVRLPFRDESFDIAFAAHGAVGFVEDSAGLTREVARVLRPGGRWVFAVTHPFRWCFPDDDSGDGLVISQSYFDRRAYVEETDTGEPTYVEPHRTLGDRIAETVAAGLRIVALHEPEWPADHVSTYEQWGARRGRLLPGTSIWLTEKPG